ncbi:MAG: OmpH family outer membrane protein, partial [Candidatus Cloacimonetes bacterium]|nr:OmpH family outer membrane protein [Candidatus Cloacimonadota bacterium]
KLKQEEITSLQTRGQERYMAIMGEGGVAEKRSEEVLAPVYEKIRLAIEKTAEEGGYTIIFEYPSESVLWFDTKVDITDTVLEYLNKKSVPKK